MRKIPTTKTNQGYTIIETMISISLFLVIMVAGMTSLLNANFIHKKSQNMRSILDNLSFIMEDMSKNLRTGHNYHCLLSSETIPPTASYVLGVPQSCASGSWGIAFESGTGNGANYDDQWVYFISNGKIWKSSTGPYALSAFIPLNTDDIVIDGALSSFTVTGAEAPPNKQQPMVTIRLVGKILYKGNATSFSLETSVSQRLIDS